MVEYPIYIWSVLGGCSYLKSTGYLCIPIKFPRIPTAGEDDSGSGQAAMSSGSNIVCYPRRQTPITSKILNYNTDNGRQTCPLFVGSCWVCEMYIDTADRPNPQSPATDGVTIYKRLHNPMSMHPLRQTGKAVSRLVLQRGWGQARSQGGRGGAPIPQKKIAPRNSGEQTVFW